MLSPVVIICNFDPHDGIDKIHVLILYFTKWCLFTYRGDWRGIFDIVVCRAGKPGKHNELILQLVCSQIFSFCLQYCLCQDILFEWRFSLCSLFVYNCILLFLCIYLVAFFSAVKESSPKPFFELGRYFVWVEVPAAVYQYKLLSFWTSGVHVLKGISTALEKTM